MPMFAIGYKEVCKVPQKTIKEKILTEVILKSIFGADGNLYKELFDNGLINDNFGTEYFTGYGYACIIVEGESNEPEKVREIINKYIKQFKENGIDEKTVNRSIKSLYGRLLSDYNSVENITMNMVEAAFNNEGVFDEFDILREIDVNQVNERLKEILSIENSAISIVNKA